MILGIDEAGRGPLIGPLVIAGVLIPESKQKEFKEMVALAIDEELNSRGQ